MKLNKNMVNNTVIRFLQRNDIATNSTVLNDEVIEGL